MSHKFPLGQTVATPGALDALALAKQNPSFFLERHASGDWGTICEEDAQANEDALISGGRIMSVYSLNDGVVIWIITEAIGDDGKREATTILLPEDY